MVGLEGGGPNSVVRVKAQHEEYPIVKREIDLEKKSGDTQWRVGDKISLLNGKWVEHNGSPTSAIITDIVSTE